MGQEGSGRGARKCETWVPVPGGERRSSGVVGAWDGVRAQNGSEGPGHLTGSVPGAGGPAEVFEEHQIVQEM